MNDCNELKYLTIRLRLVCISLFQVWLYDVQRDVALCFFLLVKHGIYSVRSVLSLIESILAYPYGVWLFHVASVRISCEGEREQISRESLNAIACGISSNILYTITVYHLSYLNLLRNFHRKVVYGISCNVSLFNFRYST